MRAETGIKADDTVLRYDGEPFTPDFIVQAVQAIVDGRLRTLDVSQDEACEMAYHFIRTKLDDDARPEGFEQTSIPGYDEPLWRVTIVGRKQGEPRGTLLIGVQTGATYAWQEHHAEKAVASSVAV